MAMSPFLHETLLLVILTGTNCAVFGAISTSSKDMQCDNLGPRDCSDIQAMGFAVSGEYRVYPGSNNTRIVADVYCDFKSPTESWLVFQRRFDGSENFERPYSEFQQGFGNLSGEFWLGNDILSVITMNRKYKLRVELEDFEGKKRHAEYSIFTVQPASDKYRLTVGGYSGNAGDSMAFQNGSMFSAPDLDNDRWVGHCAKLYRSAWWHTSCQYSNLNGLYLSGFHKSFSNGVDWLTWRGLNYSLKKAEMKLVPLKEKRQG